MRSRTRPNDIPGGSVRSAVANRTRRCPHAGETDWKPHLRGGRKGAGKDPAPARSSGPFPSVGSARRGTPPQSFGDCSVPAEARRAMRAGSTGTAQRSETLVCLRSVASNTLRGVQRADMCISDGSPEAAALTRVYAMPETKEPFRQPEGDCPLIGEFSLDVGQGAMGKDLRIPKRAVDRCTAGIRLSAVLHASVMSLDGAANFGTRNSTGPCGASLAAREAQGRRFGRGAAHRRGRGVSPAARPRRAHGRHPLVAGRAPA